MSAEATIKTLTPEQLSRELKKLRKNSAANQPLTTPTLSDSTASVNSQPPQQNLEAVSLGNDSDVGQETSTLGLPFNTNDLEKSGTNQQSDNNTNSIDGDKSDANGSVHASFAESQTSASSSPLEFHNPPRSKYTPLAFEDPIEMLFWLDDNIAEGKTILHDWQMEELLRICCGKYTKDQFLSYHLCACNGSGKDAYIIALVVMFLTVTKIRHRCIVTSASYKQLNSQTEAYIRLRAFQFNAKMAAEGVPNFFDVKNGFIVCNETGSEIKMFVTDDAGKAEGDHPFPDYPDAEMCIILNEAKSILKEIFTALHRCTGFNRWIEVSSPGTDEGDFFNAFSSAVLYPDSQLKGKAYARRVNCYECKHISPMEIELAKQRLTPAQFKSIYLAEFTSLNELVMIKPEDLEVLKEYEIEHTPDNFLTAGLDLSLGGDETVLITRDGNKQKSTDALRIGDAPQLELVLDDLMKRRGLQKGSSPIFTDIGGLGKPIAQHLVKLGWRIIPVLNNEQAINNRLYSNCAAEHWARIADLVVRKHIIIDFDDKKLIHQLGHRQYDFKDDLKITLEKKKEAKARGVNSPDRADAFVLAFINFRLSKAIKAELKPRITQQEFLREMEKKRFHQLANVVDGRMNQKYLPARRKHLPIRSLLKHFVKERE